jgi:GNAT superfamily N-acetyltransferase
MQYDNFDLEIEPAVGEGYALSARSPEGECRGVLQLPFDEQSLENQLLTLENAVLRSAVTTRRAESPPLATVRDFGQRLFNAVFEGRIRSLFDRTVAKADESGRGTRLRLRIVPPEMAALPWEFLYNPERDEFLCVLRHRPIVRYVEIDDPVSPLEVKPPLRILGVAAAAADFPALNIAHEKERVEAALEGLRRRNRVELSWLEKSTWRNLMTALRRHESQWHALHFIGHGGFDPTAQEGLLILEHETPGRSYPLRASRLGHLLQPIPSLRFVVLNSCEGARASRHATFSSTAATLVRRGIPAVLAMQYEISDSAAIEFSRSFYEALADGVPVDAAVADARLAINLSLPDSVEWGTPVLYTHSADGALFTTESGAVLIDSKIRPVQPPKPPVAPQPTPEPKPSGAIPEPAGSPSQSAEPAAQDDQPPTQGMPRPGSQKPPAHAPGLPRIEWDQPDVPVRLVIAIGDYDVRQRVLQMRAQLTRQQPVYESKQTFRFAWEEVEPAGLEAALARIVAGERPEQLIVVVSDVLAGRSPEAPDRLVPTESTSLARRLFLEQARLCGLVALVDAPERRTRDIDCVVSRHKLTETRLTDAIVRAADGLRLKAPPGPAMELAEDEAIVVRLARDERDMHACLALRFEVYERMGYLEEQVSSCPAKVEMDYYDNRSVQFLAESSKTGDVVGTVRLVLARPLAQGFRTSVIGTPPSATIERQAKLCHQIAAEQGRRGYDIFLRKLREPRFTTLPILESADFLEKSREMLAGAPQQAELSRLVVWPRYRGLGVSRLLIRAVVAVAWDLRRDILLLDCVPAHAPMYDMYGFERIQGRHGRAQDLDQVAVAMKLVLTVSPLDQRVALAQRDLAMIRFGAPDPAMLRGSKHLCLCNDRGCWIAGEYKSRIMQGCPLREFHRPRIPKRPGT